MKTANKIFLVGGMLLSLLSCTRYVHDSERGLAVSLKEAVEDGVQSVHLYIFDSEGTLSLERDYSSPQSLGHELINLKAGSYKIIAVTNMAGAFTQAGTASPENLLLMMKDASSSPSHAHYGSCDVTVGQKGISFASVKISRVFAELQLTVKGLPSDVTGVSAEVENCSGGFYPGAGKLFSGISPARLGTVSPKSGEADFPSFRVMPVVAGTSSGGELTTLTRLTLHFSDGRDVVSEVSSPALQNGGIYSVSVSFSALRTGIVVGVSDIDGWGPGSDYNGEILNPD